MRSPATGYGPAHGPRRAPAGHQQQRQVQHPLGQHDRLDPARLKKCGKHCAREAHGGKQQADAPAETEHQRLPNEDEAVLTDDRVRALFKAEIDKHGSAFKGFESIRDFALIAADFTTDNGMLTPSLKLKRRKVVETFGPLLEQMYVKAKGDRRPAAGAPVA